MTTSNLIVVVHGSALTSERPNDIDVVFAGDRADAERVVRAWAVERFGARGATLSLDLHPTTGLSGVYEIGPREGELCDLVQLPKVPGRRAPHAILRGNPEVKVYERRNISSWLRSPLSVTEMHAQILAVGGWRVRLAIESDPADAPREDWRDYCDGPRAIRSAIAKMGAEQWAALRALDPELYGLIEDVLEHGTRYVPPATLDAIRRGTPGGGPFASLDVLLPGTSMNPSAERVVTTTHGRMWWTMEGFRRLISGRAPRADATQESVTVSTTDHLVTRDGEAGTVWGLRGGGEDVEVQLRMQGSDDLRWWGLRDLCPSPVLDNLMARRP